MEIFFILMIFIMGTFFGSFFTLAVYRIPLKKDITHERSFCPNCNHKLNALDLIPVWSYIFLGGKCRYCGQKIRIRYLLLEILSGLVFVLSFLSLKINFFDLTRIPEFIFFVFVYTTLVLVAGIDKEYKKINIPVLIFGLITNIIYILYLYVIDNASIHRYSIYMLIFIIIFTINIILQKKNESYKFQILTLTAYITTIIGIRGAIVILVVEILHKIISKKLKIQNANPGFIICLFTICYKIVENIITYWIALL